MHTRTGTGTDRDTDIETESNKTRVRISEIAVEHDAWQTDTKSLGNKF